MRKGGPKQRLMAIFLQELRDRTKDIERDLLSLDQSTESTGWEARIESLLHAAHSLKGAAGLVEIKPIEMVCHRIEDLLIAVRNESFDLNRTSVQLLLDANDALAEAGRRLASGEVLAAAPLDSIRSRLTGIMGNAPTAASPPPSGHDDVVDASADPNGGSGTEPTKLNNGEDLRVAVEAYAHVPAAKLDSLLRQSGELVIARSRTKFRIDQLAALQELVRSGSVRKGAALASYRSASALYSPASGRQATDALSASKRGSRTHDVLLRQVSSGLQELATGLSSDRRAIEQAATSLDLEVRRARLQPFASACAGLDRLVRDLAIGSGKEAYLEISGGEAEIDRSVTERLQDVLRHLVRNAVDHGIEPAEERRAAGKPPRGKITISAALAGDRITVQVSEDGRGLNISEIQEQARKAGAMAGEGDNPLRQIFMPGLSTSPVVTTTSGRGIGLGIVKTLVETMRGAVDVSNKPGQGTTFTLTLPTSLGSIRALLLKVGEQTFAIDTTNVERLVRVSSDEVRFAEGRMLVLTESGPAPALDLRNWLGLPPTDPARVEKRPAVIFNEIGRGAAILVDAVLVEQELLVRTIGPRLQNLRDYAGGSILPDGTIALVLNAASVGEDAFRRESINPAVSDQENRAGRRILIADDSVTTRTLEKTILEGAGYEVTAAANGEEAWQMLQKSGADLVLADVDMPGLDGFMLTETIRQSAQFRHIPVILLTAREKAEDKRRGLEAGADAYLVKSAFDQRELLRAIAELI